MTTASAPGYIATDRYGTAIYGIGQTATAAIADAKRGAGADDPRDGWCTYPATAALLDTVLARGGAISWQTLGGVACTMDEGA